MIDPRQHCVASLHRGRCRRYVSTDVIWSIVVGFAIAIGLVLLAAAFSFAILRRLERRTHST